MSLLLGLDVGTTSVKAVVYRPDGLAVASASASTPTHVPRPRWAYYRADELWAAVVDVIRRAIAQISDPSQIVSVAVASVAEAGVLLDADGEATVDIVAWYDTRTKPQSDWLGEHIGETALFERTGLSLQPIFSLCKMLWYREHEPEAWKRSVSFLLIDQYIAFKLSGERGAEPSQASRTMLMNLHELRWDDWILDKAGIDERMLPPLVSSGTRIGTVTAKAAGETGLPQTAQVATGGHDHVCGAFAAGVTRPGQMLNSLGTAEAVFLPTSAPLTDPIAGTQGYTQGAHVAGGGYYVFGGQYTSGACIDWMRRLLGDGSDPLAYDEAIAGAGRAPAGSNGVLFLPHLRMANPPYVDSRSRAAVVGITVETGRDELARAVLEGIAFETVSTYLPLAAYPQVTMPQSAVAIGGGTRNKLLMQIKASLSGLPYAILDAEEATALGGALLGGVGAGVYANADEAIAAMQYGQSEVLPNADDARVYEEIRREIFRELYPALAPISQAISDMQNTLNDAGDV
ncbi:MAG: FGGY family carbohydrate kinase [Thermomicrobiales bacterium]